MRRSQLGQLELEAAGVTTSLAEVEELAQDRPQVEPQRRRDLRVLASGTRQVRLTWKFVSSGVCL